jgi:manganese/zinc/iron transport system permease protein
MTLEWLRDPNTRWVLGGCILLGISSGVLGSFALLRRRSLTGDALAHAALPGICAAFLLSGTRSLGVLLTGALVAGLLGALCIQAITRQSRVKADAALGVVLSVFFAVGIVLLTLIQHTGKGSQAGLDTYIFGQAASLIGTDVRVMAVCAGLVCALTIIFFKEFKLICFDPGFATGLGFPATVLDSLLMLLIVVVVVIGLQAVGVVLMAAMLIIPASTARFWTDRLTLMVWLAGIIGAMSGALGTWMSATASRMPTGPLIVLSATAIFIVSLVFSPKRGLLAKALHLVALRSRVGQENTLRSLYELAEAAGSWDLQVTPEELAAHRGQSPRAMASQLARLARQGLVSTAYGRSQLTERGMKTAYAVVRNHRLWEMFLMYESQMGADHVHRDADFVEHHLSLDTVRELERLLQVHGLEPKLPPSVHPVPSGT